jgi:hypothetical protein
MLVTCIENERKQEVLLDVSEAMSDGQAGTFQGELMKART